MVCGAFPKPLFQHSESFKFLSDPGKPGVRSLGPDVCPSLSKTPCVDLTDVTLVDEDTKSILTDDANRRRRIQYTQFCSCDTK